MNDGKLCHPPQLYDATKMLDPIAVHCPKLCLTINVKGR